VSAAVAVLAGTHLVRQSLSQCLSPLGFRVREFSDPAELVSQLNKISPDMIVIDADGLERAWRALAAGLQAGEKAITIVLLGSRFSLDDAHEALAAGVAGMILKPYEKENTRRLLELWLRRRGLRARRASPRFQPPQELETSLRYRESSGWVSAEVRNLSEAGLAVAGFPQAERPSSEIPLATLKLGEAESTVTLQRVHGGAEITGFRLVLIQDGRAGIVRLLEQLFARVFGTMGKKGKW
jgi:DNA-binding response OmpR family regulator